MINKTSKQTILENISQELISNENQGMIRVPSHGVSGRKEDIVKYHLPGIFSTAVLIHLVKSQAQSLSRRSHQGKLYLIKTKLVKTVIRKI